MIPKEVTANSSIEAKAKTMDMPSLRFYKLDAMKKAVESLGHPESCAPGIIVAGTNGKGSVCSLLSHLLMSTGLKVGSYFSPHVVLRGERVRINMQESAETRLQEIEAEYKEDLDELTYFERMTCLAFLMFQKEEVDLQILEVGLGGRLDATNISEPQMAIVTQIDKDHTEILGERVELIAAEKLGVLRKKIPFVHGPEKRTEVMQVFRTQAESFECERFDSSKFLEKAEYSKIFRWVSKSYGSHQAQNLATALQAFEVWTGKAFEASKLQGLVRRSMLKGRSHVFRQKPLLIFEGAHNVSAARSLSLWLKQNYPGKKFSLFFGVMSEKNPVEVLEPLKDQIERVNLCSGFSDREMNAISLKSALQGAFSFKIEEFSSVSSVSQHLAVAEEDCLVTGSFYLVGELMTRLKEIAMQACDER